MKISVTTPVPTQFSNANGVWQDGQLAIAWDKKGTCWAILGHTNLGGITRWRGTCPEDLECVGPIKTDFELGEAGIAFDGTRYPDGPLSRGQFWPFGLWIDPDNGDFYLYIHNETGWSAGESGYTALAKTSGEPDFRHIGLIRSTDQGENWSFVDWIITAHEVCWTENYRPEDMGPGQSGDFYCLGAGDFCMFENPADGYMYIFYTLSWQDRLDTAKYRNEICAARSPIEARGRCGTWKKLYEGAFTEDGNGGKETPVIVGGLLPCIRRSEALGKYIMTTYNPDAWKKGECTLQMSFSDDLIAWTPPRIIFDDRKDLSYPYYTMIPKDDMGRQFRLYMESNGTDIMVSTMTIE